MSWTKLAVTGLVIVLAVIIWMTHQVWSAAFLGVLLALSLTGPAEWIRRYVKMPAWLATLGVLLVVLVVLSGVGWLIGAPLTAQVQDMAAKLPSAAERSVEWLDERAWGRGILRQVGDWSGMSRAQMKDVDGLFALDEETPERSGVQPDEEPSTEPPSPRRVDDPSHARQDASSPEGAWTESAWAPQASRILAPIQAILATVLHAGALALVSVVVMIFVAFDPGLYQRGVLWLVPRPQEAVARTTMGRLSTGLRWWMLGRLASMAAVAVLTSLGMWAIGMPAPMALGALAGLLSFVPNIGPIAAAVPGVILAVPLGPWMILGAVGVYLAAQLVESNAISPLVTQYTVSVPPGLLIVTQLVLASLAGVWGMLIATPLLVVILILVQQLYIREGLKKPIEVTGAGEE